MAVQKAPSGTQAIQRAAAVLQGVGAAGTRGVRMSDLLPRLPIERSTLHRVLMCLVAEGLVCREPVSKRFYLGRTLYDLGRTIAPRYSIRDICATALTRIAAKTGDTVFLVGLDGSDGVVMDRRDGAISARSMPLTVGMRRPLGVGASGVAMLMTLADDDARRFVGDNAPLLSAHDVASAKLLNSLPKFRQRGYAISRGYGRARTLRHRRAAVRAWQPAVRRRQRDWDVAADDHGAPARRARHPAERTGAARQPAAGGPSIGVPTRCSHRGRECSTPGSACS